MPGVPNQQVQTNLLIESAQGSISRPTMSTQSLSPSAGSLVKSPPQTSRLFSVDYQTTTFSLTLANGVWQNVTWPTVGFTGLLSNAQRFVSGASVGATVGTTASGTQSLITSQSTQLLLECNLQVILASTGVAVSSVNLKTLAFENQLNTALTGPWFPTGTTYLAFSVTPNASIFNNTGGNLTASLVTLGISAQLFVVFVH